MGNASVGISAAVPTVEIDDGRVRVTKWHFEPGASTGMHTHEFDYLVVPVTGGDFSVVQPDGTGAELYQLTTDPKETTNLADREQERAARLTRMALQWRKSVP